MGERRDIILNTNLGKNVYYTGGQGCCSIGLDMLEKCAKTNLMTLGDDLRGGIMPFISTYWRQPVVKQFYRKGPENDLSRLY